MQPNFVCIRILILAFITKHILSKTLLEEKTIEHDYKIPFGSFQFYLYLIYSTGLLKSNRNFRRTYVRTDSRVHIHRPAFTKNETSKWNRTRKNRRSKNIRYYRKSTLAFVDTFAFQRISHGVPAYFFRRNYAGHFSNYLINHRRPRFRRSSSPGHLFRTKPNQDRLNHGSFCQNPDSASLDHLQSNRQVT